MTKSISPINPNLFTKSLEDLTKDFISGELKADDIPSKLTLSIQNRLFQKKHFSKMKELSEACIARLNRRGLVYLAGHGWVKQAMVPYMGLAQINGQWTIADVQKFREYLSNEKKASH